MLGLSIGTFTILHTTISLLQLVSGIAVIWGLIMSSGGRAWTIIYFASAIATCVTGFMFPFTGFLPSHATGILTLVLLLAAAIACYGFGLAGAARWTYAVCVVASIYLSAFVTVVQAFLKVPPLHALAPAGSEPPFVVTQGVVLLVFIGLGVAAARRFHPAIVTNRVLAS
jgi:hypothetical protein